MENMIFEITLTDTMHVTMETYDGEDDDACQEKSFDEPQESAFAGSSLLSLC